MVFRRASACAPCPEAMAYWANKGAINGVAVGALNRGMTREQALDLLTRQAFQTQREATEKWRRVQLSSVQLTSYFSGYSEIMDLREQRKQALGSKFVLKDFHEQFLSYGSAPVKVIKELMN